MRSNRKSSTGSSPEKPPQKPSKRSPRSGAARREMLGELGENDFTQKERGVRLQKALADAGVSARRECEKLVLEGAVTVNGRTVDTLPAWVDPASDRIEVFGRPLRKPEKHVYIALFKPRGTVCTNSDPEGRPRAIDLVQHPERPRLYCVGRLDLDSSGLLILTNDGEFANRLTHPRYGVRKGYDLVLDGSLDEAALARIEREIFKADSVPGGVREMRSSLELVKRERDKTAVHLELAEHRNLQIRPLMVELGHPVKKMRRTSFGPLKLKGLAVGEWRELTKREVDQLLRASRGEDAGAAIEPKAPRRSLAEIAEARAVREAQQAEQDAQSIPRDDEGAIPAQRESRGPAGSRASAAKPADRREERDGPRRGKPAREGPRGAKPRFDEREARDTRDARPERGPRDTRNARPERVPRDTRSERPERGPRDTRNARPERGPRDTRSARPERGPRDARGARPERGSRDTRNARPERGPRDTRSERPERGSRDTRNARPERGPRDTRSERPERGPRDTRNVRPERGPRDTRSERPERGPRDTRSARPERGPRDTRSARPERGPRDTRSARPERGPRDTRGAGRNPRGRQERGR
jgi:23S rRNA pseudouridine2605 synthase